MGRIKKLPQEIIAKIAAGEVIERPASVVKELVENSIDAQANEIKIYVKKGGIEEIKVSDNGVGMDEQDLKMSTERHATSKIQSEDDLYAITSLGFRGEALASIAAVSKLTIITKRREENIGHMYTPEGEIKEVAAPNGTTVIMRELFYNTPARKKYLKSETTEFRHISSLMTKFALAYPEISFKLYKDKKLVLQAPKGIDMLSRISYIYDDHIAKNLIPLQFSNEFLRIEGYIGKPTAARESSEYHSVFINNRYVRSKLVIDAAIEAYKAMLFLKRKPVLILKLFLDPKRIDVNVHPSKLEVKFDNEQLIYYSVHEAVKQTLERNNLIENKSLHMKRPIAHSFEKSFFETKPKARVKERKAKYPIAKEHNKLLNSSMLFSKEEGEPSVKEAKGEKRIKIRILGQVHKTYIVGESERGLVLIDQHAAHERINYEKVREEWENSKVESQRLLNPFFIYLKQGYENLIEEKKEYLSKLGFEIDRFGKGEFIVRGLPSVLKGADENEVNIIIEEILESFSIKKPQNLIDERNLFTIACRKSIKAGDELNEKEMNALIEELFKCQNPYTCPHGRPTIIELDEKELEKLFNRRV